MLSNISHHVSGHICMQSHFNRALAYIYICVYIVATVVYRVSQGSWGGAVWTIASWTLALPGVRAAKAAVCKSPTAANSVSRKLLNLSGIVINKPHYHKPKFVILHPKVALL